MTDKEFKLKKSKEVLAVLQGEYERLKELVKTDASLLPLKEHCAKVIRNQRQVVADMESQ